MNWRETLPLGAADATEQRQAWAEIKRLREAFEPVRDWYAGDNSREFAAMLADAVADLQHDRKEALECRQLRTDLGTVVDWINANVPALSYYRKSSAVLKILNRVLDERRAAAKRRAAAERSP